MSAVFNFEFGEGAFSKTFKKRSQSFIDKERLSFYFITSLAATKEASFTNELNEALENEAAFFNTLKEAESILICIRSPLSEI